MFEQNILFHKGAVQNFYAVNYFKTSSMCIFNVVENQTGIGFIIDTLFGNITYLHNLCTVVERHTNIVLIYFESQPELQIAKVVYCKSIPFNYSQNFYLASIYFKNNI